MRFAELTAPAIRALNRQSTLVIAPVAACEQHGRHLPVSTDTILCGEVADGVDRALSNKVLVLPVLWIGASEHHVAFGGTLTATLPTYETLLVELLRPLLRDGFRRTLILNGHGGNNDPFRVALRRLNVEFPNAILTGAPYWDLAALELSSLCAGPRKSMGHACEIETSLMMHLRPDLVDMSSILDDGSPVHEQIPRLSWALDFAHSTDHGVVGFPQSATPERGRQMLESIIRRVVETAEKVLELPLHPA
jgi:creatinine amidohydrolase